MTLYILKTVLCSALFLVFYIVFLEKEKMHRFKRFYLLGSIIFSATIPFLIIETGPEISAITQTIEYTYNSLPATISTPRVDTSTQPLPVALLFYTSISCFLLYRFVKNILILSSTIKRHLIVPYYAATLVLTKDKAGPHSFLDYVFVNKEDFESGVIEKEILVHELVHVRQKHSIDVLFVELLSVLAWFNPFLYFYKKAIQLNHEFLADDFVITMFNNTLTYQHLLLGKASNASNPFLTSQLNFSIAKKRLIMMTRNTSMGTAVLKQIILIPLVAVAVFLFSTITMAQDTLTGKSEHEKKDADQPKAFVGVSPGFTKEGVTEELLKEYGAIVDKYAPPGQKWGPGGKDVIEFQKNITKSERDRLENIFQQMSKEQQARQTVIFVAPARPLARIVPTKDQLEAFKNPRVYGVWVDEKKVSNATLDKYSQADFAQVFVSKLYANARKNVTYLYQVNLMTNEYYRDYYDKTAADKENKMAFQVIIKR